MISNKIHLYIIFTFLLSCSNLDRNTFYPTMIETSDTLKLVVLGNSITNAPALDQDWTAGWGLSSSTPEKDFVHILHAQLSTFLGYSPYFKTFGIADFERNFNNYNLATLDFLDTIHPDIILLRIGDNIRFDYAIDHKFWNHFENLLNFLQKRSHLIVCTSSWYYNKSVDDIMRACCNKYKVSFVDISYLASNSNAHAYSERTFDNEAIGSHPGDKGMKDISDIIFNELIKHFK